MSAPAPTLDTALSHVPEALQDTAYPDLVACFEPHLVRLGSWQRAATVLDRPMRRLAGLFLFGERVAIGDLPEPVAEAVPVLVSSGLAHLDGHGGVRLAGLCLLRPQGVWMFSQLPQPSPTLYLGDDSFGLANRLGLRAGSCLDLCAGPGLQALLCAQRGHRVVAAEINPVAAALCRVNVALNGFTDRVHVRVGDLFDCVPGERFDNVLANPPLLPIPEGVEYPFVGDGGPDGLRVVRRILAALPRHLSDRGQLQLIGMALSDGLLPLMLDDLAGVAAASGLNVTLTVPAHLPVGPRDPWSRGLARTAAMHSGRPYEEIHAALVAGYGDSGATHLCTYALRAVPGSGRLTLLDVSNEDVYTNLWFC